MSRSTPINFRRERNPFRKNKLYALIEQRGIYPSNPGGLDTFDTGALRLKCAVALVSKDRNKLRQAAYREMEADGQPDIYQRLKYSYTLVEIQARRLTVADLRDEPDLSGGLWDVAPEPRDSERSRVWRHIRRAFENDEAVFVFLRNISWPGGREVFHTLINLNQLAAAESQGAVFIDRSPKQSIPPEARLSRDPFRQDRLSRTLSIFDSTRRRVVATGAFLVAAGGIADWIGLIRLPF